MENLILVCIVTALFCMLFERCFPARALPLSSFWWTRVVFINLLQAMIVYVGTWLWDPYLQTFQMFKVFEKWSGAGAGFSGYLLITFVFYWWHRFRHESPLLWRIFHQFHHSAQRIETITSFYKHPAEIFLNSLFMGGISYCVLGLSPEQASWATFFSATGEYIYHMNIRTPYWLGFFFQRPEMHRVHHQRFIHTCNFADFPLWDILFGTFENPRAEIKHCGFGPKESSHFLPMLMFEKVEDRNV